MKQITPLHVAFLATTTICSPGYTFAADQTPQPQAWSSNALQIFKATPVKHHAETSISDLMSELGITDEELASERKWVAETFYQDEPKSIKTLRLSAGLSQKQLAEKIGSQQSYIAKLEKGEYIDLRLTTLRRLASALAVSFDEINNALPQENRNV